MAHYALSVKQPWAALLAHGLKTIEIRRWPTARHGPVYIHAARIPDDRPEGWRLLSEEAASTAELRGGLIGAARLVTCKTYCNVETFTADQKLHLNEPSWFEQPMLYGFVFAEPRRIEFQRYSGWFRFFPVEVAAAQS